MGERRRRIKYFWNLNSIKNFWKKYNFIFMLHQIYWFSKVFDLISYRTWNDTLYGGYNLNNRWNIRPHLRIWSFTEKTYVIWRGGNGSNVSESWPVEVAQYPYNLLILIEPETIYIVSVEFWAPTPEGIAHWRA